SPTQWAGLLGTCAVLLWLRSWWAHFGGVVDLVVLIALPLSVAWAVRHVRMEGRSPLRMLGGIATYAAVANRGWYRGRPMRPLRRTTMAAPRVWSCQGA